jgi:tetraacyldisaccharide 4'-kinase
MLACWARDEGYRVAVLSRGYGGSYKTDVLEVSDGSDVKVGARECGDEPYLLATKLRGIPVVVSRNRQAAGMWAHERFGSNLFLLDDGFQHVAVRRNLDLVLVDSNDGFGNAHLLPLGPLREPLTQLARGDAFVATRWKNSSAGQNLVNYLKSHFPGKPVFRGTHVPEKVVFPFGPEERFPQFLKGKRVLAFAGIARPMALRETLTRLGADVVHSKAFRDHHPFTPRDVESLIVAKERTGAEYLITTEKDWVRLAPLALGRRDTGFIEVRFEWIDGRGAFFEMFRKRVDSTIRPT